MIKTILLSSAICASMALSGQQVFNRAVHNISERPNPFLITRNGAIYFTTISWDANTVSRNYLYKYDGSGNLKLRKLLPLHPLTGLRTLDNNIVVAGSQILCGHTYYPDHEINITKLDSAGNVLWNTLDTVPISEEPVSLLQLQDSGYVMFTQSAMYTFNKVGSLLTHSNSASSATFTDIQSAVSLPGSNILLSRGTATNTTLEEISTTGSVISTKNSPVAFSKMLFTASQTMIGLAKDGKLYRHSAGLQGTGISSFSFIVKDFTVINDTIYAVTTNPVFTQGIALLDTSFAIISQSSSSTNEYVQDVVTGYGTKLAILGQSIATKKWSARHYFTALSIVNKNGSNNFSHDLQLTNIAIDSSYSIFHKESFIPVPAYVYMRPKITVKNKGSEPVSWFKLNYYLAPSVECGDHITQDSIGGITIAPGDSMIVTSSKFVQAYTGVLTSPTTTPVNFCFYSTLPNGQTDKVYENNEICKTFNFVITSVSELKADPALVSVFPNPFNNETKIGSDFPIIKVEVFNMLGSLVYSIGAGNQLTFSLNAELKPGIYLLNVKTEKGTVTRRLIRE